MRPQTSTPLLVRGRRSRRSTLRLGLLSDIHARADALARALARLERAGVDRVVCLGDVVEKGPEPDAVVETLARLAIPTVRGNHDHNAVRHASLQRGGHGGMNPDTIAWLDALPDTREYLWAGAFVTLAHGSPIERGLGVRPGAVPKPVRRWLRRAGPDVVLLGHTHVPMLARFGDTWLVNPGSVAHGRCGLGATCAVLELPTMALEVLPLASDERRMMEAVRV